MSLRIYGNRLLKTLPGEETRPTLARVRAALFNIWQGEIAECRWLDLCAGSGSMGAEALCRGAAQVVGIEQSLKACAVMRENWQPLVGEGQQMRIIKGEILQKLKTLTGQQFDRIYLDPPYASDLYQPVLEAIAQLHLLTPNGELAVEHRFNRRSLPTPPPLEVCRQKIYGNTGLTFYRLTPNPSPQGEGDSPN
jgi:16S rRNA (guanine966-N2)-methyltransferase